MKILVTGACGFVGHYLVGALARRGHQIVAAVQDQAHEWGVPAEKVTFDITQADEVQAVFRACRPDAVFHLAAQSMVPVSWNKPAETLTVNTIGSVNMLEALRREIPSGSLVMVGSSDEYGLAAVDGTPVTEERPCLPQNPYAVSKFAAGQLAMQWAKRHALNVIHLRPFNHFGPGQRSGYVVSDFASQLARIECGQQPPLLKIGDLTARRDFTDVRDVIRAYVATLECQLPAGVYNICSGVSRSAREVLDALLALAKTPVELTIDPQRLRPSEVPVFVGSCEKFKSHTQWSPQIDFSTSIADTLDWWRNSMGDA